ncbi:MAG: ABC transporter ATP-binding protein [Acidimicrobiales bacterium]|nr:ABC transporter ATP-binding protein [Acidimicrobiales bacterium]
MTAGAGEPLLALRDVSVRRDDRTLLDRVTWEVRPGERWVVLGPNGSGKTTLVRVASLYLHPSAGEVELLGERLGRTDVRSLRRRIGLASAALADQLRPQLTAAEVVMTARHAALEPWWHEYDRADRDRAAGLLGALGCAGMAARTFGTLSSGERQRVLLARTLMAEPALVLLDEPTAGLDLGGRETLVSRLGALAADPASPPLVLVTHHVDEIPAAFTHVLLLHRGRVLSAGPLAEVLTARNLSGLFGLSLRLERRGPRWAAWAEPDG